MIMVDDEKVVSLVDGEVREDDLQGSGSSQIITPLLDALDAEVNQMERMAERGLGPEFEGKALIVGHREIDYKLLSSVLYTAGQAKLAQFQFVILKK